MKPNTGEWAGEEWVGGTEVDGRIGWVGDGWQAEAKDGEAEA